MKRRVESTWKEDGTCARCIWRIEFSPVKKHERPTTLSFVRRIFAREREGVRVSVDGRDQQTQINCKNLIIESTAARVLGGEEAKGARALSQGERVAMAATGGAALFKCPDTQRPLDQKPSWLRDTEPPLCLKVRGLEKRITTY